MGEYTTVLGDTWDIISYKLYGTEMHAGDLMDANPEHITVVLFSAGTKLKVPDIEVQTSNNQPPWKRGALDAIS